MIEWSDQHLMIRDAVRKFVEAEIKPNLEEFEHGDTPPYDVLRKMLSTFGIDQVAKTRFDSQIAREKAGKSKGDDAHKPSGGGDGIALTLIPIIELCRYCPGMVTAMGVSVGLTASAIMSRGTTAQKETLGAAAAHPREDRRLGDHRAGLGLGRLRRHEVDREARRRRRLRPERQQDLHHQRPLRRHDRVHLQARRGQRSEGPQGAQLRSRQGHARA